MSDLEKALRNTCKNLTKEEVINLACLLVVESLHTAGRKKKEA